MVVFVATHHNPQSAAPRQSDITPESFPGLNAIAQQKFDLPYHELSPALQRHVREEAVRRAANDLLEAVKVAQKFFINPGSFNPLDVEHIYAAAVRLAEGRA